MYSPDVSGTYAGLLPVVAVLLAVFASELVRPEALAHVPPQLD